MSRDLSLLLYPKPGAEEEKDVTLGNTGFLKNQ